MIEWPALEDDQLEQVTEDTIREDHFQRNAFCIERTRDGGAAIKIKLVSEVELPQEVLQTMLGSIDFDTELTDTIMQRLLIELNAALVPVMRFKIEEFKNRVLRLN